MSFSAAVKEELCREPIARKCCARAEAYGVLLFCNSFSGREIKILTGCAPFAGRLTLLFRKAFKLDFDRVRAGGGKQLFEITAPDKLVAIQEVYGYDPAENLAHHINLAPLEEEHCKIAFLRGAFLTGGSVSDPEKSYHLELVTTHFNVSRELTALLQDVSFAPKQTVRNANYVSYFKPSETIADFLTRLGAPVSAMEIMNAKLGKNLRGSINRRVNCDSANLDKTVDASMEQTAAIQRLEAAGGLGALPDKLRETAELRLQNPELTLTQLAELCDPPVSKSCLNHRLRRLMELAK